MSTDSTYEYKMTKAPTSWWTIDKEETEKRLNRLAEEGWELDQVLYNWFFGTADLLLRRPR